MLTLNGYVRWVVDHKSGYVKNGIAYNGYELSVLVNQLIWKLRQDFGSDCDLSQITIY